MAIKVQRTDPGITQFEVDGETILVAYEPREIGVGAFRAAYHGSNISGPTLAVLAGTIRRIRGDEADKARREQARKETAKNPLPAVAVRRDSLQRVGVRGLHATSREPLVTFPNGQKGTHPAAHLLRPLSDEEWAETEAAVKALAEARANADGTESTPYYRLVDEYEINLTARYDVDQWVAEYEGRKFHGISTREIEEKIGRDLVEHDYPFTVYGGVVIDTRQHPGVRKGYWATAEDAQRYLDAYALVTAAQAKVDKLLQEYRFDISIFQSAEG
jgi:hypothetical protein